MRNTLIPLLLLLTAFSHPARSADNVVLITLDGLRWQELFSGADTELIRDARYTRDPEQTVKRWWRDTAAERRSTLMPFFWDTIATEGVIYGNRALASPAAVRNGRLFSYPGYNEILTGAADPSIDSNAKVPNRNVTVLEWVNRQPGFEGRVAAFASWDVFPYIINEERSNVPVNAGFAGVQEPRTEREEWLNEIQAQTPSPWHSVRLDVFTHHYALEYLRHSSPRLLYVGYGETDDFAHDAEYHHYLDAAHRADGFVRDLWTFVQSDPRYRDRTTFVITTDHGRGSGSRWTDHEAGLEGAEQIWIALLGPGVKAHGEARNTAEVGQDQIASTVAQLLGLDYASTRPVGPPLPRP